MDATKPRRAVARAPLAPVAALPARLVRHDTGLLDAPARGRVTHEHPYGYDPTRPSRHHGIGVAR